MDVGERIWEKCSNFAADLVRGGSNKRLHEAVRLAEKPVISIIKCTQS